MSEQILGGEIIGRTDIYLLGVMMYEMLTGRVPFDRGASVGTLMAHVNDVPPPMRQVNANLSLSKMMDGIVARCLEKDANKRFASMKDLLNALKRVGTEDGSMLTDTHESMPMARVDLLGAPSYRTGADSGPQTTSISLAPGSNSSQITDSMLGPAPAPPLDTDAMAKMRPKGRPYVWFLAAAVAAGIAVTVVATSKPHPGDVTTTATGTPAGTGAPVAAQDPTTAPASPTAAAVEAANAVRTVKVDSDPPGASVTEGSTELCASTPCDAVWKGDSAKGEHKLQLSKKGFKPTKLTVATTDTKVSTKLDTAAVYVPTAPRTASPPPDGTGKRKPNPYGD